MNSKKMSGTRSRRTNHDDGLAELENTLGSSLEDSSYAY